MGTKYQVIKEIPYEDKLIEVDTLEYGEWEDALDNVIGNTKEERLASGDWITYDFLMDKGYFVSKPTSVRPTEENLSDPIEILENQPERIAHEPAWTQSRILAERERLLRDKEKHFEQRVRKARIRQAKVEQSEMKFYHADGTPYTHGNYIMAILGLLTVILAMFICVLISK